jgi:hypothetical protein
MSGISIIGLGNMARVPGGLALAGGNAVEAAGRDPAQAAGLAGALGGATAGKFGSPRRSREPASRWSWRRASARGILGRPVTEEDAALPGRAQDAGTLRSRNEAEIACPVSPNEGCGRRSCGSRTSRTARGTVPASSRS